MWPWMTFECVDFIRTLPLHSHSMLTSDDRDEKLWRLLNFIYFALIRGYAVVYLAPHNEIEHSKWMMRAFGINVPWYEEQQQLRVLSSKEFFIDKCKSDREKIEQALAELTEEAEAKQFKGVYGAIDTSCFFENGKVEQLVEYELSIGRKPSLNLTALCIYDVSDINLENPVQKRFDPSSRQNRILIQSNRIDSSRPARETENCIKPPFARLRKVHRSE